MGNDVAQPTLRLNKPADAGMSPLIFDGRNKDRRLDTREQTAKTAKENMRGKIMRCCKAKKWASNREKERKVGRVRTFRS